MSSTGTVLFDLTGKIISFNTEAKNIFNPGEGQLTDITKIGNGLSTFWERIKMNPVPLTVNAHPIHNRTKNCTESYSLHFSPLFTNDNRLTNILLVLTMDGGTNGAHEEDKYRALALLGGGLAHDYNNIFTVILGNIALARTIDSIDEEFEEILTETEKATTRAKDMTSNLLLFSRTATPDKTGESMPALLTAEAAKCFKDSSIKTVTEFAQDLYPASVDKGLFLQGLIMLFLFIKQWMNGEGIVRVTAGNAVPSESTPFLDASKKYIKITIIDSGPELSPVHPEKYFEPYAFKNKKGLELNLSITYAIIRRHNGFIELAKGGKGNNIYSLYLEAALS
ncbi:MAG: HAMP domain-containing histidine kinase [Spirochaetales bacterium]|nr:HAMP domain-containing histidine kinase [Spirochaetales bacterium]